ncbi:MAG: PQQ-binding-like beta-propeller repeat protein [Verrucomicrobiae bacterium]|nr:PQQ-binding-like beta-propeller repeat protein [Verrucomicrobiae bacterium]
MTHKSATKTDEHPWPRALLRTAIVAGAFCAVVATLLLVNWFQSHALDPLKAPRLKDLKALLVQRPDDEALKKQIRALDLEHREAHARRVALQERGGWLLIGGGVVFLFAMQAAIYRKKLPKFQKPSRRPADDERATTDARWAVGAVGVALGAAAWTCVAQSQSFLAAHAARLTVATTAQAAAVEEPAPTTPFPTPEEMKQNWPRFRGPGGLGISPYANAPLIWNGKTGENILWKTKVPVTGPNSPVIWGRRVFVSGATASKEEIYCFDALSGKLLWQRSVEPPKETGDPIQVTDDGGHSPATMATDGRRAYAIFANAHVVAVDYKGNVAWTRNLGRPDNSYGHSSSLELVRDRLIIQFDQGGEKDGKSKLIALNTVNGDPVWESPPRPVGASWATPITITVGQQEQIITCSLPFVIAHDAATGKEVWRSKNLFGEVVPSATFANGLVFTAMEGETLTAIRPDGTGDVTKTHVVWVAEEGLPDIASPLCDGERVYLATGGGEVTAYDAKTGKKVWAKELDASFKSSPSLAGDRVYVFSDKGVCYVLQAGAEFKELARNELGEEVLSTPAFADGRIYVRAKHHLFCIGGKK